MPVPPLQVEIWSLDTKWDVGIRDRVFAFTREKLCEVMMPRTGIVTPKQVMTWVLQVMRPSFRLVSCHDDTRKELASDHPLFPEVKTICLTTRWSKKMEGEIKQSTNALMYLAVEGATSLLEHRLSDKQARKSLEARLRGEIQDIREELAQKRERLKNAQQRVKELEHLLAGTPAVQTPRVAYWADTRNSQNLARSPTVVAIMPDFGCDDVSGCPNALWETSSEPWG